MENMSSFFARVAAVSPETVPGDPAANAAAIIAAASGGRVATADAIVFPELAVTGCTCGDLFFRDPLLDAAEKAVAAIVEASARLRPVLFVGAPVRRGGALYNACVAIHRGRILAAIPRSFPLDGSRWFAPGFGCAESDTRFAGQDVPFGTDIILRDASSGVSYAAETGEDPFAPGAPSRRLALCGAEIIANPFAVQARPGGARVREAAVAAAAGRLLAAYACAGAGPGESTAEGVFSGAAFAVEPGAGARAWLAEAPAGSQCRAVVADIDVSYLRFARRQNAAFAASARMERPALTVEFISGQSEGREELLRSEPRNPFLPQGGRAEIRAFADEMVSLQAEGLARRMLSARCERAVVGVSGGLDSTLALLVCRKAFLALSRPLSSIRAITMPGFGTTGRTLENARSLCAALGLSLETVDIASAAEAHLRDIKHPEGVRDAAYENAQARERTQVLMDVANGCGGIVVGTGDLSELALGWCTYNGDHMSMYAVNAGVPKTVVREAVSCAADGFEEAGDPAAAAALRAVVETPVSPELLPPDGSGAIAQKTEDIVGPYELHDFFLFHFLKRGAGRAKTAMLARSAFAGKYAPDEIDRRLDLFLSRFFSQQFKRSCSPDGPDVLGASLSPRGAWMAPSDVSGAAFK